MMAVLEFHLSSIRKENQMLGPPAFTLSISLSVAVPPNIAELKNLEVLNFFNNQIEELPTQISSLQKLKHLNLG